MRPAGDKVFAIGSGDLCAKIHVSLVNEVPAFSSPTPGVDLLCRALVWSRGNRQALFGQYAVDGRDSSLIYRDRVELNSISNNGNLVCRFNPHRKQTAHSACMYRF